MENIILGQMMPNQGNMPNLNYNMNQQQQQPQQGNFPKQQQQPMMSQQQTMMSQQQPMMTQSGGQIPIGMPGNANVNQAQGPMMGQRQMPPPPVPGYRRSPSQGIASVFCISMERV